MRKLALTVCSAVVWISLFVLVVAGVVRLGAEAKERRNAAAAQLAQARH